MSTEIYDGERIHLTLFSGGASRGMMLQITESAPSGRYVEISPRDFAEMVIASLGQADGMVDARALSQILAVEIRRAFALHWWTEASRESRSLLGRFLDEPRMRERFEAKWSDALAGKF